MNCAYWCGRIAYALLLPSLLPKNSTFLVGYRATSSWYYRHELQKTRQRGL